MNRQWMNEGKKQRRKESNDGWKKMNYKMYKIIECCKIKNNKIWMDLLHMKKREKN